MREVKHYRCHEDHGGWWLITWWRPEKPGIRYQCARVFGKGFAEQLVEWLNAEQSPCATSGDFSVVCKRNGIGCRLEHPVL